jgi:hypothetical protein
MVIKIGHVCWSSCNNHLSLSRSQNRAVVLPIALIPQNQSRRLLLIRVIQKLVVDYILLRAVAVQEMPNQSAHPLSAKAAISTLVDNPAKCIPSSSFDCDHA